MDVTTKFHGWRKSGHSDPNGECVEAGRAADGTIGVRDSKLNGNSPILELTRDEWRSFLQELSADGL